MSRRSTTIAKTPKAKAKAAAQPAGAGKARFLGLDARLACMLLNLLSAVLLSLAFAPYDAWPLAYVALVPMLTGLALPVSRRWALLGATLGGLAFWAGNLYWLTWITLAGYLPLVGVTSLFWLAGATVIRAGLVRRWPAWLVLPLAWVALEYARSYVLSGFPWFYLAHTQYTLPRLLQITDATGQYGVSFFVAVVNGALFDLVLRLRVATTEHRSGPKARIIGAASAAVLLGGLLGYGSWRLGQDAQRPGPVIALVGHSYPVALGKRGAGEVEVLLAHVKSTAQLLDRQPAVDLVVWPETMLPLWLNPQARQMDVSAMSDKQVRSAYRLLWLTEDVATERLRPRLAGFLDGQKELGDVVASVSGRLSAPILAGGTTLHDNPQPLSDDDLYVIRNSAMVFDRSGPYPQVYSKVHCVPFSEYVPFKYSWLGLHKLLRAFVPEEMPQLDPGREFVVFDIPSGGGYRVAAPICYEGTFDRVVRDMVMEDGRKRADIIANISNDGWFVCQWGNGPYSGSNEHHQHLSHYVFRAIETRMPVVRAVNTGISASIDPNGRLAAVLAEENPARRTMISGVLLLDGASGGAEDSCQHGPRVLVDDRTSLYSLVGDVFAQLVSLAAVGMTLGLVVGHRRQKRKEKAAK